MAVSSVLLIVAHTLPNFHSTGTRDGETYSPSTFNPHYDSDAPSAIVRLLDIVAPLLSTLLPLLCLLIICFRSARIWDTLKGMVAGVPLAIGIPYFVSTLDGHLTLSGYDYESSDYEIGAGIWLRECSTVLMTVGAVLILVAIIKEKPLGMSESPYLPGQSPSAAALPYSGGSQPQLTGSALYYAGQQPSLTQHDAARMGSASGEGNSSPTGSHSRYAPPNHPAHVSQSDQASALHSPASQQIGAFPTGLPGSGLPAGPWTMQGYGLAPSPAAYGPEYTGFRPVRAGLTTGKWVTVLTLAISGVLLGFLSLFVPFISQRDASGYVDADTSSMDLQRWSSIATDSYISGGFNMFLFSLLTLVVAVLLVFLVVLNRILARWVAFVAGGSLIMAGAIMLVLLALLGNYVERVSTAIDDMSENGFELSFDIGALVYGVSLALLIVSGLLFCIFSAQRPAMFFTPGGPAQYPGQVGGFAGQPVIPAGQPVMVGGQPLAASGQPGSPTGQP
ncbi:MAG: hypothetical protein Q3979_08405 [Actinomycetaceae bacterium]|nr:hypothetical protein [Actinomycetaceae bacterium]